MLGYQKAVLWDISPRRKLREYGNAGEFEAGRWTDTSPVVKVNQKWQRLDLATGRLTPDVQPLPFAGRLGHTVEAMQGGKKRALRHRLSVSDPAASRDGRWVAASAYQDDSSPSNQAPTEAGVTFTRGFVVWDTRTGRSTVRWTELFDPYGHDVMFTRSGDLIAVERNGEGHVSLYRKGRWNR